MTPEEKEKHSKWWDSEVSQGRNPGPTPEMLELGHRLAACPGFVPLPGMTLVGRQGGSLVYLIGPHPTGGWLLAETGSIWAARSIDHLVPQLDDYGCAALTAWLAVIDGADIGAPLSAKMRTPTELVERFEKHGDLVGSETAELVASIRAASAPPEETIH